MKPKVTLKTTDADVVKLDLTLSWPTDTSVAQTQEIWHAVSGLIVAVAGEEGAREFLAEFSRAGKKLLQKGGGR